MAIEQGVTLATICERHRSDTAVHYDDLVDRGQLLPPLDHDDPAHWYVTGTGLTHLGSAKARDEMHDEGEGSSESAESMTDSMRLFEWGVKGGKAADVRSSMQPEWFYKGNGTQVVRPGGSFAVPFFSLDGGEEAEIVGLYLIGPNGDPFRVGFALGNEFSDHVMEKQNYLYLAHSKLRPCSYGPELLLGDLPQDVAGKVRISRAGATIWSQEFRSGESNMAYYISELEYHHFKYDAFRQPGDVHCHFFGTATLSFSAGVEIEAGDTMEIESSPFGRPLVNVVENAGSSIPNDSPGAAGNFCGVRSV